jgi:5'-methylthioadenosine phosphorylase
MKGKIGIIGGSGIADSGFFKIIQKKNVKTPYGKPSAPFILAMCGSTDFVYLPRHGIGHSIPPHDINFRANIWGMKHLGVTRLICPSAVGSLRNDYMPGEICIPDQFIDFTKKRTYTFFDTGKVTHVSTADPFCEDLRSLLSEICKKLKISYHDRGTYVCIEGPRFSTRAESKMFRSFADIIGMTLVPEAQLARELGICYSSLAMITDYDVWADKPVNVAEVVKTMKENAEKIQKIVGIALTRLSKRPACEACGKLAAEGEF